MNWFQKVSITYKLLLGFGLSFVIAVWMGLSGSSRMAQLNGSTNLIVNDALEGATTTGKLTDLMRKFRLDEFNQISENTASGIAHYEDEMKKSGPKIEQLLAENEKSAIVDEDRQNAKELKALWADYTSTHDEQLELAKANDDKAGSALMLKRRPVFSKVSAQLEKIIDWNEGRGKQLATEASSTYNAARDATNKFLITFLVIGVTIVVFVWKLGRSFESSQVALSKTLSDVEVSQEALSKVLAKVRVASNSIATGSVQVSAGNAELSTRTEEQAASLEETASSMEEMTSTIKQNADNAKLASQLASQARDVAESGGTVVKDAVSAMTEINDGSKKIADIISVIDEIAFQTNLLALNAAVEAARVGEQGRGFAVVAAEVRNLAGRSATAAKEIKALVQDSVGKVQIGSELVNESGKRLHEIVESVKKVADIVAEISAASMEQASGVEQVNKAVMQMDKMTQQNAALVEEVSAASQSMSVHAKELQAVVATTKIDDKYELTVHEHTSVAPAHEMAATGTHGKPAPRPSKSAGKLTVVNNSEDFEEF